MRTLVSGVLAEWPANQFYPLATIRASLGQAGCIEVETKARERVACGLVSSRAWG